MKSVNSSKASLSAAVQSRSKGYPETLAYAACDFSPRIGLGLSERRDEIVELAHALEFTIERLDTLLRSAMQSAALTRRKICSARSRTACARREARDRESGG